MTDELIPIKSFSIFLLLFLFWSWLYMKMHWYWRGIGLELRILVFYFAKPLSLYIYIPCYLLELTNWLFYHLRLMRFRPSSVSYIALTHSRSVELICLCQYSRTSDRRRHNLHQTVSGYMILEEAWLFLEYGEAGGSTSSATSDTTGSHNALHLYCNFKALPPPLQCAGLRLLWQLASGTFHLT